VIARARTEPPGAPGAAPVVHVSTFLSAGRAFADPGCMRTLALAALTLALAAVAVAPAGADDPAAQGLRAEFFDAIDLTGTPVTTRVDPTVSFDWDQAEPVPGVGDAFSARWTGTVTPPSSGDMRFYVRSDDGVRLWVDGRLVIDDWEEHEVEEHSGEITLEAGRAYDLRLEYFDIRRHAVVQLRWRPEGGTKQIVPASALRPPAPPAPPVVRDPDPAPAPDTPPGTGTGTGARPVVAPVAPAAPIPGDHHEVPQPDLPPPSTPVAGESFNAEPTEGTVLVRRPQDGALIPLAQGASLPVGTRLDTRDGDVHIETAPAQGVERRVQWAEFTGATVRVAQGGASRVVTLDLNHGDFESMCRSSQSRAPRRAAGRARSAQARGSSVRRVFARGRGRFRTRGRHAAATVRGTTWMVEDRCDGTLTRVTSGVVDVEDLSTGRRVATLRAGDSAFVRPGQRARVSRARR